MAEGVLEKHLSEIEKAAERLQGVISEHRHDPQQLFFAGIWQAMSGSSRKNLQKTGSFKIRGAYNRISQLTEEERAHGIVTLPPAITHRVLPMPRSISAALARSSCRK